VVKSGRHDDPASVEIDVVEHAGGVTICAVYPDVPGQPPNECLPGGKGHLSNNDNDVQVVFTITVPAGVDFRPSMVTGTIAALQLRSHVMASTVTGDVAVTTSETATATAVTGSVDATLLGTVWDRDQAFTTVTGNVTVQIPGDADAHVMATTVTGSVMSDFPLSDRTGGGKEGDIGAGGQDLVLAAVTGTVRLRRN
jgi:hypothetical protein